MQFSKLLWPCLAFSLISATVAPILSITDQKAEVIDLIGTKKAVCIAIQVSLLPLVIQSSR
jgi:hypothetical protein